MNEQEILNYLRGTRRKRNAWWLGTTMEVMEGLEQQGLVIRQNGPCWQSCPSFCIYWSAA